MLNALHQINIYPLFFKLFQVIFPFLILANTKIIWNIHPHWGPHISCPDIIDNSEIVYVTAGTLYNPLFAILQVRRRLLTGHFMVEATCHKISRIMMASRHGHTCCITGPLVTGGFPSQTANNVGLWCFLLVSQYKLLNIRVASDLRTLGAYVTSLPILDYFTIVLHSPNDRQIACRWGWKRDCQCHWERMGIHTGHMSTQ